MKWQEIHPVHQQEMIHHVIESIEEGKEFLAKCSLLCGHPEMLDADPRFRPLFEEARDELGHLLTPPEKSEPGSAWSKMLLQERHRLWTRAIETLEQGNYQLLWQRTLVEYPELIQADARLAEIWVQKPEGDLPPLTRWEERDPRSQRWLTDLALGISLSEGRFNELLEDFQEFPELIDQDMRLREVCTFYQKNPPREGERLTRMRWKDFSAESQSLMVETVREQQSADTLKNFFKSYPEVKKLYPELYQDFEKLREKEKQERWDSGDFTWKELEGMQKTVLETSLEWLEQGLLDSVEEDLEKYPQLRHKDPRLMEIWEAMRNGKPREEGQFGWAGLTEPSRRFVLEAALRDLEEGPDKAKLLLQPYPELRGLDARLAEL